LKSKTKYGRVRRKIGWEERYYGLMKKLIELEKILDEC
jgi:hypothetical protein